MSDSRVRASRSNSSQPVFSAARIALLMAESAEQAILPTPEQTRVIEQPLGGSVLVVAGAGSGKTETMANRVVWVVANGLAAPSQVLGLTFTRKAAGELGERITERLIRFTERIEIALGNGELSPEESARAASLIELMGEGLDLPEVSTYNAFASSIVQEFGALAGVTASATVIDATRAWGIARDIVRQSDEPALVQSNDSVGVIVKQLMNLDHAVSDNLTTFDAVRDAVRNLQNLATLPYNEKKSEGEYAGIRSILQNMEATELAVRLAERFSDEKRSRGLIEFSDQLALAVETLRRSPAAVSTLRARTPVVLLDEVQDTSVGQTVLLSTLFRGNSVMAVGDPHQSIYGFRGASASNLQSFHRDFRGLQRDAEDENGASSDAASVTLSLSTSWRNPGAILAAANRVSAPLAAKLESEATGVSVQPLTSRAQYLGIAETDDFLNIEVNSAETVAEEFAQIAEWMREARAAHLARTLRPATAAVVFRNRRHMAAVSEALWVAGVPNRIVGLGGLLTTPEITDLVSVLRCIWYADAGSELLRLLAGPRFQIGVADLKGLDEAASWFSVRDHEKQKLSDAEREATSTLTDPERSYTLLDVLDEIASMSSLDHRALTGITQIGRERLREAGQMLRSLRSEVGGDILGLLRSAVASLRLDIELDAAEHTGYDGSAVARANLDAFSGMIEDFLASDELGTLDSVLSWLERATEDDEAAAHVPEPEPGTVQLITVHGSKGLEWDLVAIPRLVSDEFPGNSREGMGWLRPGQLPDALRGDAASRPRLNLERVGTQKEALDAVASYQDALRDRHAGEERRLAYVAMTRAASRLLLSYSFWGGQKTARTPSVFLQELVQSKVIGAIAEETAYESDPASGEDRTLQWPLDPLGRRRHVVTGAANALRKALAEPGLLRNTHPVVELLLAERASDRAGGAAAGGVLAGEAAAGEAVTGKAVAGKNSAGGSAGQYIAVSADSGLEIRTQLGPEQRLTASTFHEFIEDPVAAERRRLRPLPVRPYRRTRTGNLFHEWVERRVSTAVGTSLMLGGLSEEEIDYSDEMLLAGDGVNSTGDELTQTGDQLGANEDLAQLIAEFERSRWADRRPIAVELEITLPFAGRMLVCKLDAVYQDDSGETPRVEIVDWKSGRPPRTEEEKSLRFLQLDLYRHAYARWAEFDPDLIDVTLFYVAEGQELKGEGRRSFNELEELWRQAQGTA